LTKRKTERETDEQKVRKACFSLIDYRNNCVTYRAALQLT